MADDLTEQFRPTLLVGVGGTGMKIAERVYRRALAQGDILRDRLEVIGIDTDDNDLRSLSALERRQTIQISTPDRIYSLIDANKEAEQSWFGPRKRFPHEILNMTLLDGAAQIRLLTRLAFTHMVRRGEVQQKLGDAIARIAAVNSRTSFGGALNILITGSLAGATGSGLFLPVALLLGKLCRERSITSEVRGLFLMPDVYVRGGSMLTGQIDNVLANAHASLKELNAVNLLAGERGAFREFEFDYVPGAQVKAGELPFRAMTLIDYENTRGSNLGRNIENYMEMSARAAFMLLFTPVGQRTSSVAVNDARAISAAASQGTNNLYSGIGVSTIEYPAEEVADYLALKLALENLEGDWLRLDRNFFERQRRYEEQRASGNVSARRPEQGQAFLEDLEQLGRRDRLPFFAEIDRNLHPVVRNERDQTETVVPRYDTYLDAIEAEVIARFWNRDGLKAVRSRPGVDADQLKNMTALVDTVRRLENQLDDDLRVVDAALVNVPEDDFVNILLTADDLSEAEWRPHHIQSYLIKGGPHLVEVRAFLYALAARIAERRAKLDPVKKRRQLLTQANVFDPERSGTPDARRSPKTLEAAREFAGRGVIGRLIKGGSDFQETYSGYFNGSVAALRAAAEEDIRARVLDLLADEVAGLERHFAGLFLELRSVFDRLREQARLSEIAHSAEGRSTDGNVFVAADREAKIALWDELRTGVSGLRLAGSANRALAVSVYGRYRKDKRERKSTDYGALGQIFVKAIVDDFARAKITGDLRSSYDFGVVEAIKRDAARLGDDFMGRLRSLVDLIASQSEPFLTLADPQANGQRSIFWAVHPDVRRDIADPKAFEQLFTVSQGEQPLIESVFSPKQLMCVNSRVLLELTHLTKLGAGDPNPRAVANRPVGRYFDAYRRMVDGLIEEDLDPTQKSPNITPHLDVRWHRPGVLPEIDPSLGEAQRADIYRAYVIARAMDLVKVDTHYDKPVAEFSTVGRTSKAGVAVQFAETDDPWGIMRAFEDRSELARATLRYWDDVKRRLSTGQQVTPEPVGRLTDPALVEGFLRLSVVREDGEARDLRTRALLTAWMTVLEEIGRIVDRELEAPGRNANREQRIAGTREAAFVALTTSGVRRETVNLLDRLFGRAFEDAGAAAGAD